jgi:phage baseplate assembly protein W
MAKLYNQKTVAQNKISLGNQSIKSFTYKGFNSNDSKNGYKSFDLDLVKQDIINHFYIRKGEKLQNPDFGTIIWDILFEPFTDDVKKLISKDVEAIINYDPRISVNSITIDSTEQGIRIEADITYLPFNIVEKMTFNFDKNNAIIN